MFLCFSKHIRFPYECFHCTRCSLLCTYLVRFYLWNNVDFIAWHRLCCTSALFVRMFGTKHKRFRANHFITKWLLLLFAIEWNLNMHLACKMVTACTCTLHCVSSRSICNFALLAFQITLEAMSFDSILHTWFSISCRSPVGGAWRVSVLRMGDRSLLQNRVNHITSISCRTYLRVDKHSTPFYCA